MKLLVTGATGRTGQLFVQEALDQGKHDVVAVVRNPDKMTIKHDKLQIVEGNVLSPDDLERNLSGCDAVVSCIESMHWVSKVTLYSEATEALVAAMMKTKVRRLIVISSWCCLSNPDHPWLVRWILKPLFIGRTLDDMARMEAYLETKCPDIDYTAVRAPGLRDDKKIDERELLTDCNLDYPTNMDQCLSRANLTRFMRQIVEDNTFIRKCVAIGVPKHAKQATIN